MEERERERKKDRKRESARESYPLANYTENVVSDCGSSLLRLAVRMRCVSNDDVEIEGFVHQPQERRQTQVMQHDGDGVAHFRRLGLIDAAHEQHLTQR